MPDDAVISTGYRPRLQQAALHRTLKRFNVLVAHRRFGKTVFCINELVDRAVFSNMPDSRFAYIAPFFNQAKDIAWEYVKHYTAPLDGTVNESELRVDLPNSSRIRLYGADNADRMRGGYFDGVILDEYAQMNPRVWGEIIRPMLADRLGWAIFIGTPMGRNDLFKLYDGAENGFIKPDGTRDKPDPEWRAAMFKASLTGIIAKSELEAAKRAMSADQYEQEFECSFEAAVKGAYYGRTLAEIEANGQIANVPWDPSQPVYTAWDLGVDDATAIWFAQIIGRQVCIIDYYEMSGEGMSHYAKILAEKPYTYPKEGVAHILPHDAEATLQGREAESRVAILASLGVRGTVLPKTGVADGIEATRVFMRRCWFDKTKCARGIEALKLYRQEWDDKKQAFKGQPLHDWASDPADAFRYLAIGLKPLSKEKPMDGFGSAGGGDKKAGY